jgi:hypothetical protein
MVNRWPHEIGTVWYRNICGYRCVFPNDHLGLRWDNSPYGSQRCPSVPDYCPVDKAHTCLDSIRPWNGNCAYSRGASPAAQARESHCSEYNIVAVLYLWHQYGKQSHRILVDAFIQIATIPVASKLDIYFWYTSANLTIGLLSFPC